MKSLLLLSATLMLALTGCVSSGPGRAEYPARTNVVVVADDYDYYPGSEVYYSRAHGYYYYRDGNTWVHRPNPPRAWVRTAPSVNVHLNDAPDRHHTEIVKQYPRTWSPAPRVAPVEKHTDDDRHDGHDDHDKDRH